MHIITLTQGKSAIIDDEDLSLISEFNWSLSDGRWSYYAVTSTIPHIHMHRILLGAKHNQVVDHINGNGLDNRRTNIRIVTPRQNQWNKKGSRNSISRFKGLRWREMTQKWEAIIRVHGKQKYLGSSRNEVTASLLYDQGAIKYHGEYARTNWLAKMPRGK